VKTPANNYQRFLLEMYPYKDIAHNWQIIKFALLINVLCCCKQTQPMVKGLSILLIVYATRKVLLKNLIYPFILAMALSMIH